MFWHLAATAAAYLVCASAAADIAAGNFVVKVLKPRLADVGSDQGTCCLENPSSKVQIYQAVLHERVEFQVSTQVVADASTKNHVTITIQPTPKTGCFDKSECVEHSCSYRCEPKNKVAINSSECYLLVATSRTPSAVLNLSICVYNRSAEPLKVLHPPAAYFDKKSVTLKYEVGGYPLPANITVTCDEQSDGRTTHQINASISFVQEDVGHYDIQLDNVTAGELRCRVAALSEFHNFTSESDLINVTSAYKMSPTFNLGTTTEQFISQEVSAVTAKAYASILLRSEPNGPSKEVIVGLSTAAVASTVLIAIAVGVTMWRRSATRKQVTLITNENHHTTIVNNDNRQTIVNNCQHNYVDVMSHSDVVDIKDMLLAWDDTSPTSDSDHAIHSQCQRPHEDNGCINDDNFEGVS